LDTDGLDTLGPPKPLSHGGPVCCCFSELPFSIWHGNSTWNGFGGLSPFSQQLPVDQLPEAGIESCLIKPAKQSRLFECLIDAMDRVDPQPTAPLALTPVSSDVSAPMEGMRILLADDNRTNREVALGQLRKLGYKAEAVANGLEAVRALEQIPYDVILMDCQMPELDGYEATQTIRKRESFARTMPMESAGSYHRDDSARHAGRTRKMSRRGNERLPG
jgi:CheY-like chemotaxis protein